MASFLQNNGDILLDAVLTDYGRRLLAKGDGSFNIVKFAFGDDEIDYGLYDSTVETVLQDVEIMKTPILEAITNNAASMKSQLITLGMTNILFLPVLKLNASLTQTFSSDYFSNGYVVPVDTTNNKTTNAFLVTTGSYRPIKNGVLYKNRSIIVDQGLDSKKLDQTKNLKSTNPSLYENAYNIYIDSKFGFITDNAGNALQPLSIDDDGIAVYKFTEQTTNPTNTSHVTEIVYDANNANNQIIDGTQGSRLKFGIMSNENLSSDTYFDKYGDSDVQLVTGTDFMVLRSSVRVVGVTTGCSLEIPVLYAKVQV